MLAGILGGGAPPVAASAFPTITPFQKDGLVIEFSFEKDPNQPANTVIQGKYTNNGASPIANLVVQCAVPKYMQLKMEPASGNALAPGGGVINQKIHVSNTLQGQKPLMMRLKLDYAASGVTKSELVEVRNFPQGL